MQLLNRLLALKGPNNLRVDLDAREIYPDDPGNGTPAMISVKDSSGKTWSGTYGCVLATGYVDEYALSLKQLNWLDSQEEFIDNWLAEWSGIIETVGRDTAMTREYSTL